MHFGLYAPVPHVTVGSPQMAQAVREAAHALPPGTRDGQFELSRQVLTAADANGFDIILFAERHLGTDLEAWMLAAAIAPMLSEHMRAMVAVHPTLWHPQIIAKMSASLDRICKGRTAINLVTGWNAEEHEMYGGGALTYDDDRYVRAEEFIEVVRGLWAHTPYSFNGRFFRVDAGQLLLKPATPTPPEIFTASRSPRGLDMVARIADWWFLDYDKTAQTVADVEESLRRSIAAVSTRAARLGRRVRFAFNPFISFGPTKAAAIADAQRMLTPDEPDRDVRKMEERIGPAMKSGCIGHPDQVRAQLRRYADIGIELFLFKFPPTVERVEEINHQVIVPLRGRAMERVAPAAH